MLLRFQAPSLLTSSPFSNIYRNGFPALASCGPHAFGLKIQLQWWRFLITLPSEKWYRNDWSNLLKLLKYLMTFRLLETPFHPSYPTLSKMEAPSPLRISETWSSLQALCMAVCYTKSNRSSNSRELLGGADTTVSVEYAFFLAMVLYPGSFHILFFITKPSLWSFSPDVQKKAHAELDAVIGQERLPGFSDQPNLPYINAIVTEVLRWNSVAPTGITFSHALSEGFITQSIV